MNLDEDHLSKTQGPTLAHLLRNEALRHLHVHFLFDQEPWSLQAA